MSFIRNLMAEVVRMCFMMVGISPPNKDKQELDDRQQKKPKVIQQNNKD